MAFLFRFAPCAVLILCACASTSSLPDLTNQTLDQVRSGHADLVGDRGVHRVLRGGVENYFFVGAVEAEADDPPTLLRQEATVDARDALLEHFVPDARERTARAIELVGVDCPYDWGAAGRRWAGCFAAVDAVVVRPRKPRPDVAGVAPPDLADAAPSPSIPEESPPLSGGGNSADGPPSDSPTAPAEPVRVPGPAPPSTSGEASLAEARALAARGECRAAVAVYDRLLEEFAAFAVGAGVVREKFEVQKGCP